MNICLVLCLGFCKFLFIGFGIGFVVGGVLLLFSVMYLLLYFIVVIIVLLMMSLGIIVSNVDLLIFM